MKRLTILLGLFAAGLAAASFAAAGAPPGRGHGKHDSTSAGTTTAAAATTCRPMVSTILKGTFTAAGGSGFTMNVTHANHHGQKLLGAQTITVDDRTKFRRNGPAALADFVAGDRLLVQARTCKARHGADAPAAGAAAAAPLLAKRVVGHPANPSSAAEDSGSEDGGSTTTISP